MITPRKSLLSIGLFALIAGCSDKPHDYGRQQPDVNSLDKRDRGLQSKNVIESSDQMAMELLAIPALADSPTQWTVVVMPIENISSRRRAQYDVFMERLKTNLGVQGHGRIRLIQNRDRFRDLQARELEGEEHPPGPAGVQPQFGLRGTVTDLPNRGTDYFLFSFELDDTHTRDSVWTGKYEVKVAR